MSSPAKRISRHIPYLPTIICQQKQIFFKKIQKNKSEKKRKNWFQKNFIETKLKNIWTICLKKNHLSNNNLYQWISLNILHQYMSLYLNHQLISHFIIPFLLTNVCLKKKYIIKYATWPSCFWFEYTYTIKAFSNNEKDTLPEKGNDTTLENDLSHKPVIQPCTDFLRYSSWLRDLSHL